MDNYATHKTESIKRWLIRHPRFHFHFTLTSSSWLNLVESFLAMGDRNVGRRGVHRSVYRLEKAILVFLDVHNEDSKPFVWTTTANQILDSLRRYCEKATRSRAERAKRAKLATSH